MPKKCCKDKCYSLDTCYYKKVTHVLPNFPDKGVGVMQYEYYQDDDPNVPGYAPIVQEGLQLEPSTIDNCVSVLVSAQDSQLLRGSAGISNWFHGAISSAIIPERTWSFEFRQHKCCVLSKVYIQGTDVDAGEAYDISAFTGTNWVAAPENGVPFQGNGIYSHNTTGNESSNFVLEWDVEVNGLPPVETITALSNGFGQSVFVYSADYYVPLKSTIDCKGILKHFDCDGEFIGEVLEATSIEAKCCGDCPEPSFLIAPPSCNIVTTPGFNERLWFANGNAVPHDTVSNIFNGPADPSTGLPSHPNLPDTDLVVPDSNDSSSEGGNNGANQAEWYGWINIPQDGVILRDINGNSGEKIKYWSGAVCTAPSVIGELVDDTTGPDPDFGELGTYNCGWYFIAKQASDVSAFQGIQLQWDLGAGFVDVADTAHSATQPEVIGACIKKPVPKAVNTEPVQEVPVLQTAQVLRASSNSTGFRWADTNLVASAVTQSPYNNIISLTNTNPVPVLAEIKWNFGDSYMFIADGDMRVRVYGEVLNGTGGLIESTGLAHYNWLDSEPFNNGQQQTEMRPNGTAFNDTLIIVQPGDTISVRQYITAQALSGGAGNERIYWYNGQSVITMHPQIVYVP